jgi:septal ring factor EnvC (AmiA/AmiB activator)
LKTLTFFTFHHFVIFSRYTSIHLKHLENRMQHKHTISPFKKILPALVATLCMTAFTVFATLAFGVNALVNRNVSATQSVAQPVTQVSADQASVQQLQDTIAQYQQREAQYQQELQKAADQINATSEQNQQFRQLITALQNAGVIQITQDGRVTLGRGG